jgi:hypothetical protein
MGPNRVSIHTKSGDGGTDDGKAARRQDAVASMLESPSDAIAADAEAKDSRNDDENSDRGRSLEDDDDDDDDRTEDEAAEVVNENDEGIDE